jgi:hypothetical protein
MNEWRYTTTWSNITRVKSRFRISNIQLPQLLSSTVAVNNSTTFFLAAISPTDERETHTDLSTGLPAFADRLDGAGAKAREIQRLLHARTPTESPRPDLRACCVTCAYFGISKWEIPCSNGYLVYQGAEVTGPDSC